MTLNDLKLIFEKNNVPSTYYVFGGLGSGGSYGIEENIAGWEVYFSERGSKFHIRRFSTEDAACRALLMEIDDQMFEEFGHRITI